MATVKDTTCQGGEMQRIYKNDGFFNRWTDWRLTESGTFEIQDHKETQSTTTMKEYPQVRKTGVDAVHAMLPTEGLYVNSPNNLIAN